METVFLQQGSRFRPVDPKDINIYPTVPAGTYSIGCTPMGEFFLEREDDFELPTKLYGTTGKHTDRIINTFESRPNNTGILLTGEKGSGKTLLAKNIASTLQTEKDYITILVNSEIYGESFNKFLQDIKQPATVLFDEFEKIYKSENQDKLLTIFDGVYASKKLFILTCNSTHNVNTFMINRPGRLFYSIKFKGLSEDFITDYCTDNLNEKDNTKGVLNVAKFFAEFSFDMLKALVEEMNRYNENATDAMLMLNMNPEEGQFGKFEAVVLRNGVPLMHGSANELFNRSPLSMNGHGFWLECRELEEGQTYGPNELTKDEYFKIQTTLLEGVQVKDYDFVFGTNDPNTKIAFKKEKFAPITYKYGDY